MDPNTLNLYPDPDPGLLYQFGKKKFKIVLEKKVFLKKGYFYFIYKNKMSLNESMFTQLCLLIVNLYLKPYILLPPLYPIFTCVDPDPERS